MRKSSKLLAVLLTLCLMFGAITAIFVSADGEAKDPFNVTGHSANLEPGEMTFNETTGTHNYFYGGVAKPAYDATRELSELKYVTLDFDICISAADETRTADNSRITVKPKIATYDAADSTHAYLTGGGFYLYLGTGVEAPFIGSTNTTYADGSKLATGEGEYTHITLVFELTPNTSWGTDTLEQRCFVNGEFNSKWSMADIPHKEEYKNNIKAFNMLHALEVGGILAGDSINIKNIVFNHYTDKDPSLAAYTVNTPTAKIYDADGVVYNANYVTPGAKNYVEFSTGEKFYVPAASVIGKKITDGATITVNGMNLADVDVPVGVGSFTVKCENDGAFELSDASQMAYAKNGDVYTKKQISYTNDTINDRIGTVNLGTNKADKATSASTLGWAYNNSAKSPFIYATHYENSYTRIHYQAGALKSSLAGTTAYGHQEREAEVAWRAHSTYGVATEISKQKYMTFDFDFGADAYAYTFTVGEGADAKTYYATALTEAEAVAKVNTEWGANTLTAGNYSVSDPKIAFPTDAEGNIAFRMQFVASDKEASTGVTFGTSSSDDWYWLSNNVYVRKLTDGYWYLCSSNDAANPGKTARLSGEVGFFDHITYVFEIKQDGETTVIVPHIYINGTYAFTCAEIEGIYTANATGGDKLKHNAVYHHFQQFMLGFGKDLRTADDKASNKVLDTPGYKMYDRYSLAFQNMTITYYDEIDVKNTNLDESLAETEKAPLYTLNGVVYNEDYVTPNPGYITLDGKNYSVFNAAFDKAEGKTLYFTNYKLKNYVTKLNSFTVVADDNSDFTLDPTKCWGYYKDGNTYTKLMEYDVAKWAMSLYNAEMDLVFYFPAIEGLELTGVSYTSSTFKISGTKTVNGVDYLTVTWNAPLFNLTGAYSTTVTFEYTVGDKTFTLTTPSMSFGVLTYAKSVAKAYPCGEEAALVKAMVDYRYQVGLYQEGVEYKPAVLNEIEAFNALYANHGEECKCTAVAPKGDYINVGVAHTDKSANQVVRFGSSGNYFALFVDANEGATVKLSYTSLLGAAVEKTETSVLLEGETVASARFSHIKAYDIDNEFTITISEEGKEDQVYVFSLADYIAACEAATENEDLQKVLPVVKALANYAVAAENYKIVPKK